MCLPFFRTSIMIRTKILIEFLFLYGAQRYKLFLIIPHKTPINFTYKYIQTSVQQKYNFIGFNNNKHKYLRKNYD